MADKWKDLKKAMEKKRDINKKNKEKAVKALKTDTLTVQLLYIRYKSSYEPYDSQNNYL